MCQDLHRLVNNGRILQLPHPFAQLSVQFSIRQTASFESQIHFLKKYHLRVVRLEISRIEIQHDVVFGPRPPDSFLRCFFFLKKCAPTMTHLSSPFWARQLPPELQELYLSLQFPNLETLKLVQAEPPISSPPQEEQEWLQRILTTSPKLVNLSCTDWTFCSKPPTSLDLKNIRKLDYDLEDAPGSSLYPLLDLTITCKSIKSLWLNCMYLEDPSQLTTLKEIIARVGATVEILSLTASDVLELQGDFPDCPRLHTLSVWTYFPDLLNLNALSSLNFLEFEQLQCTPASTLIPDSQVYRSVKQVKVGEHCSGIEEADLERLFKLFPNAGSWAISWRSLPVLCEVVRKTRKKIQNLRLNPWRDEKTKTSKYLLYLQDLEELDLVNLKSLPEAQINIFSKLTRLRILRISFYRLKEETVQNVVRDLLQHARKLKHLDKTVILDLPSKDNFELVELICTQIPSVEFQNRDERDF